MWSAFDWEEFLREKKCPWEMLARWQVVRDILRDFPPTPGTRPSRSDVYDTIMGIWHGPSTAPAGYGSVTSQLAEAIANTLRDEPMQEAYRQLVAENRVLMGATPTGPACVTLAGLTDDRGGVNLTAAFDPIELLATASETVPKGTRS